MIPVKGIMLILRRYNMRNCTNPNCKCENCQCGDNCQCGKDGKLRKVKAIVLMMGIFAMTFFISTLQILFLAFFGIFSEKSLAENAAKRMPKAFGACFLAEPING